MSPGLKINREAAQKNFKLLIPDYFSRNVNLLLKILKMVCLSAHPKI